MNDNNVTVLSKLTEDQFNKLKESGLLTVIYPDAPEQYKDIPGLKPKMIENPDLTKVKNCLIDIMESNRPLKDEEHDLHEIVLKAFYGENVFTYFKEAGRYS